MYIQIDGSFVKPACGLKGSHMRRFGMLVLLLMTVSTSADAESSGATDNELYAAYCKGAMSALDQENPNVQRLERRFAAYPWLTGVMTDPRRRSAVLGIGAAIARGRADQQQCTATLLACNDTTNNPMRENPGASAPKGNPGLQLLACTERDPTCPRVMRCVGPDALPF